jgi:hypothetical protein
MVGVNGLADESTRRRARRITPATYQSRTIYRDGRIKTGATLGDVPSLLLQCRVGSRALGTPIPRSNTNLFGLMPLSAPMEQFWCTGSNTETTIYRADAFARIVAQSSPPGWLVPLYVPARDYLTGSPHLFDGLRDALPSRLIVNAFARAANLQFATLVSGQTTPQSTHGYDVTFAYHLFRTLTHGLEYARRQSLKVPMHPRSTRIVLAIRKGMYSFREINDLCADLLRQLDEAAATCTLPELPNFTKIAHWLESLDSH